MKKSIREVNDTFRILVVTGPRQVGKSTILENMMPKNMTKVSWDKNSLLEDAKNDPEMFLTTYGKPLFIDEVQKAPELFSYLKIIVDEDKSRGQFWLSGSQSFSLMKNITESLAGRVGIIKMNSLTYKEINNCTNDVIFDPENIKESNPIKINDLFQIIFNGGMPELYDVPNINRNRFFESYLETYIKKDVRELINIKDLNLFKTFMKYVAVRNGKTLSYEDIAKDVMVSGNTIKEWISVLVASRIIYLLEPYNNSKIKRLTHKKKIIFMDSGLACYLAGFTSVRDLQLNSKESGIYLEAYIISELIKSYDNAGVPLDISYLRNKDTEEIDLLIYKNLTYYPLQIKKTADPNRGMLKNFRFLENAEVNVGNGGIISFYEKLVKLDDKNYYIPISSVINPKWFVSFELYTQMD